MKKDLKAAKKEKATTPGLSKKTGKAKIGRKKKKPKVHECHAHPTPTKLTLDYGHASDPGKRVGEFPYVPVGRNRDELEEEWVSIFSR